MKTKLFKLFFIILCCSTMQITFAQSTVTSTVDVTIKIVKKITVAINDSPRFSKRKNENDFNIEKRKVIISYTNQENSFTEIAISSNQKKSISELHSGATLEISNLTKDEQLFIDVVENNFNRIEKNNHYITIVY